MIPSNSTRIVSMTQLERDIRQGRKLFHITYSDVVNWLMLSAEDPCWGTAHVAEDCPFRPPSVNGLSHASATFDDVLARIGIRDKHTVVTYDPQCRAYHFEIVARESSSANAQNDQTGFDIQAAQRDTNARIEESRLQSIVRASYYSPAAVAACQEQRVMRHRQANNPITLHALPNIPNAANIENTVWAEASINEDDKRPVEKLADTEAEKRVAYGAVRPLWGLD